MSGNTGTAPSGIVAQAMVFADDLVASDVSKTERSTSVKTDILRRSQRTIGEAIDNDALIEQPGRIGFVRHFVREGHRIPEWSEGSPIRLRERAVAGKNRLHFSFR